MDVILNPAIRDLFGERIATHSFHQDVGSIRRRITADIEPGVFVTIEASWCELGDEEWGALICALTYTPEGRFTRAFKYDDDGSALSIAEDEGLRTLSALFDLSWSATRLGSLS